MAFSDPNSAQNAATGLVAPHGWGTAVDASFNFLRGAKAGCHLTSVVGTSVNGSDIVLPWATELYDVNGCHDNVTNNSRITVPSGWGGLWLLGASIRTTGGGGSPTQIYIGLNGGSRPAHVTSSSNSTIADVQTCLQVIVVLAVGDYVETWVTGTAGQTRSTAVASRFYAHWLYSGS